MVSLKCYKGKQMTSDKPLCRWILKCRLHSFFSDMQCCSIAAAHFNAFINTLCSQTTEGTHKSHAALHHGQCVANNGDKLATVQLSGQHLRCLTRW